MADVDAEVVADELAVSDADADVVNVVGAAWAMGRVSDAPVVTVTPITSPTAARTPLTPNHGNNFDGESGS